jgi:acetyl esterase/lipase
MRIMKFPSIFFLGLVSLAGSMAFPQHGCAAPGDPEIIPLWSGEAPVGGGKSEVDSSGARITVFRPEKPNGAAVVICPGGGYGGLVTGPEGTGIARWLNAHGLTGIVLEYRLPKGRQQVPLLDAQRALRIARSRAKSWGCDPQRLGIMGFSAGGHLASTAATQFDPGNAAAADAVEKISCRPDFALLVYPVITMGEKGHDGSRRNLLGNAPSAEAIRQFSSEKQVTDKTPPAFLAHALDDTVVPVENSRMFHAALQAHHATSQLLELPSGGHGLNGYKGPMWDAWQSAALQWLAQIRIIPKPSPPPGNPPP